MTLRLSDSQLTILAAACGREDASVFPITAKLTGGALQKVLTSLLAKGLLEEIDATDLETVWRAPEDGGSFTLRAAPSAYEAIGIDRSVEGADEASLAGSDDARTGPTKAVQAASVETGSGASASQPDAAKAGKRRGKAERGAQVATQANETGGAAMQPAMPDGPPVAPAAAKPNPSRTGTKQDALIAMLRRPDGASIDEIIAATGWQPHTVRGAISGALRKKLGLAVASDKVEGRGRVYRLPQ